MDRYRDGAIVTVDEILRRALPDNTEVLAGEGFLGRRVASVAALRPRPASLGDLRGDELVLLSTDALAALDPPPSLAGVVDALKDTAAAIAVRGIVSEEAVIAAELNRIPLLILPAGPPLTTLAREVQAFLAERRTTWYQNRHLVSQELTALALDGKGVEAIADRMCRMSGCAVAILDVRGTVLAMSLPASFPLGGEALADQMRGTGSREQQAQANDTVGWLTAPVLVRNQPAGTAYLAGERPHLGPDARLVLEAGATAAAIELAREHAVRETVDRMQGDLIGDLVSGSGNQEELIRRAAHLGYDLDATRVAIAVQLDTDLEAGNPAAARRRLSRLPESPVLGSASYRRIPTHAEGTRLTLFVEVEPAVQRQMMVRVADEILRVVGSPGMHPTAGISRPHAGPTSFRLAHDDAVHALQLGRTIAPARQVVHFDDLGIYRLLLSASEAELSAFHDEALGRLAAYDRERGSVLLPTLDAYLRAHNAGEAAKRLSLHRNSLLYRLRRIREITGADLDDPETRLSLHLALRAGEALRAQRRANET